MNTILLRTLLLLIIQTVTGYSQEIWYNRVFFYPIDGRNFYAGGFLEAHSDLLQDHRENAYTLGEIYTHVDDFTDGGGDNGLGQPVYAFGDGVVTKLSENENGTTELHLCHTLLGGKKVTSVYHNLRDVFCSLKEEISRGDTIGTIGYASHGFGPELFFELRKGGNNKTGQSFFAKYTTGRSGGSKYGKLTGRLSPSVFIDDMGYEKVYRLYAINSLLAPIFNDVTVEVASRINTVYVRYGGKKYTLAQARARRIIAYPFMMRHDWNTGANYRLKPTELLYPNESYGLYVYLDGATLHIPQIEGGSLAYTERAKTDILWYLKRAGYYHLDVVTGYEVEDGEDSISHTFYYYKTRKEYEKVEPRRTIVHEQYKFGPLRTILPDGNRDKAVTIKESFTQ